MYTWPVDVDRCLCSSTTTRTSCRFHQTASKISHAENIYFSWSQKLVSGNPSKSYSPQHTQYFNGLPLYRYAGIGIIWLRKIVSGSQSVWGLAGHYHRLLYQQTWAPGRDTTSVVWGIFIGSPHHLLLRSAKNLWTVLCNKRYWNELSSFDSRPRLLVFAVRAALYSRSILAFVFQVSFCLIHEW